MEVAAGAAARGAASSFHEAYEEQASLTPGATAVVSWGGSAQTRSASTYEAVCLRSRALAGRLLQHLPSAGSGEGGGGGSGCGRVLAVELPRTHADFLPLLLAASRLGLPFVLLSTDLPERDLEKQRRQTVLAALRPCLCVVAAGGKGVAAEEGDEEAAGACASVTVEELGAGPPAADAAAAAAAGAGVEASALLCFLFTGGTHRTKIVEATHAMVLHERFAYRELWRPRGSPATVLAHTSVYWGASALGQLSIALAYGGAAVWAEATEIRELRRCIEEEGVNVLGVVPDHLDLLAPKSPARELPAVEVVFTWGERLPRRISDRWRDHPRAKICELLIATEYWLSLWADPMGDGEQRAVGGAEVLVLTDDGSDARVGELGELCLSGPMVMAGYHSCALLGPAPDPFYISATGKRFFRTRDLVRRTEGGVVYKGRADMMAKDKGKWVDMLAVEDALSQIQGVAAAKVLPDPAQEHFHAFVALHGPTAPGPALDSIRAALPPRVQVWQVPELPRHPVTRKVDAARLLRMLTSAPLSWPLEGGPGSGAQQPMLRKRLVTKMWRQAAWTVGIVGVASALSGGDDLREQLLAGLLAFCGGSAVLGGPGWDEVARGRASLAAAAAWLALSVAMARPGGLARLGKTAISLLQLTYGWLLLIYVDDARSCSTSRVARWVMFIIDALPLWKCGAFVLLMLLRHASGLVGGLSRCALHGTALLGAALALRRGRLLAWPVVFWLGAGHQIDIDCSKWLSPLAWPQHLLWQTRQLLRALYQALDFWTPVPAAAAAAAAPSPADWGQSAAPGPALCERCGADVANTRWPARDDDRRVLCDPCGSEAIAAHEARASAWLSGVIAQALHTDSAAEPPTIPVNGSQTTNGGCPLEPVAKRHKAEAGQLQEGSPSCVSSSIGAVAGTEETAKLRVPSATAGLLAGGLAAGSCQLSGRELESISSWWWYRRTTDTITVSAEELERSRAICGVGPEEAAAAAAAAANGEELSPEGRLVCTLIGEVEPLLKPVWLGTVLMGLDSLRVARLSNAIRARFSRSLTALELREAKTVNQLVGIVAAAPRMPEGLGLDDSGPAPDDIEREYAVWYSPGQYAPMGNWVLRTDAPLDRAALVTATQRLVDRHPALRVEIADPVRYNSFMFDCATLFTLYAPLLDSGPFPARQLRRLLSRCLTFAWSRIRVSSREAFYGPRMPETMAPLKVLRLDRGQTDFERALRQQRSGLELPGAVTAYQLFCHLDDVWDYDRWRGRFALVRRPEGVVGALGGAALEESHLLYADLSSGEWGPVVGPASRRWEYPPYGFPALFCVPLSSGGVVWLRLEKADEMRVCYRAAGGSGEIHHLVAYRAAPRRPRGSREPVVVSFVGIGMLHCFADGNCALPLVQDLFAFYEAAQRGNSLQLPPLDNPFKELERRLFDTLLCRMSPMRSSIRGGIWRHQGRGFGHTIGLDPKAMAAVVRACACYRVPLDVALLGLVACAMARADGADQLEFTLYAPMRDGAADAMAVGLFADWRDLSIAVDFQMATTLGTVLQVSHKIQHRQWSVFNALRKPERVTVNIQPLDFERRAGFVNLGENMWHGGDQIGREEQRGKELPWTHQPANFVIEQQDEETWWVLASASMERRQAPWMRSFVYAFRHALASFLFDPLMRVHEPLPEDAELLSGFRPQAAKAGFL